MRESILKVTPSTVILGLLKCSLGSGLDVFIYRLSTKKIFSISKTVFLELTEQGVGVSGNLGILFTGFQVTHASTTSACILMLFVSHHTGLEAVEQDLEEDEVLIFKYQAWKLLKCQLLRRKTECEQGKILGALG